MSPVRWARLIRRADLAIAAGARDAPIRVFLWSLVWIVATAALERAFRGAPRAEIVFVHDGDLVAAHVRDGRAEVARVSAFSARAAA